MLKLLFGDFIKGRGAAGLLIFRVVMGAALMLHGWGKIQKPFNWMGPDASVPGVLQFLAALSEFGGGIGVILGFLTPIAAFGIACTMSVAILMVHLHDPFVAMGGRSKEPAAGYLATALLLMLAGPGRFSLDWLLFGRKSAAKTE